MKPSRIPFPFSMLPGPAEVLSVLRRWMEMSYSMTYCRGGSYARNPDGNPINRWRLCCDLGDCCQRCLRRIGGSAVQVSWYICGKDWKLHVSEMFLSITLVPLARFLEQYTYMLGCWCVDVWWCSSGLLSEEETMVWNGVSVVGAAYPTLWQQKDNTTGEFALNIPGRISLNKPYLPLRWSLESLSSLDAAQQYETTDWQCRQCKQNAAPET